MCSLLHGVQSYIVHVRVVREFKMGEYNQSEYHYRRNCQLSKGEEGGASFQGGGGLAFKGELMSSTKTPP